MANATLEINGTIESIEPGSVYNRVNVEPTELTSLGGGENEKDNTGVILSFWAPIAQAFTVGGAVTIVITQTAAS